MKLNKVLLILLLFVNIGLSQQVRTANLYSLITNIRNAMPGRDSYGFVVPTTAEQDTFASVTNLILNGQYALADSLADYLDYSLYEWYDTGNSNHLYYVLMENGADQSGGVQLGWGTFIFDPAGYEEVIIEVPHPIFDTNTWKVGFKAYQNVNAKYFLMAGTHRYANGSNPAPADVAHNTQNTFHTVHQKVSPYSTHSLQVHGFSISSHPDYPDVVLSNGSANPTPILDSLSNAISSFGYTVGIYDGINWTQLGATTNKQGQWSRSQGYSFIHMETEYFIRASQSEWQKIINAMNYVFLQPFLTIPEPVQNTPQNFALKQNYPNPFNSSTIIPFYLTQSKPVTLNLYNVLGQKILGKDLGILKQGEQKLTVDMNMIRDIESPGGVYFYQIIAGDFKLTRKMIYLP